MASNRRLGNESLEANRPLVSITPNLFQIVERANSPISAKPINVEVLFIDGCPNVEAALQVVLAVAESLNIRINVIQTLIENPEDAETYRFPGSPTIRVEGVDVERTPGNRASYAFGCRRYKEGGVPAESDLVAAFLARKRQMENNGTDSENSAK